MLSVCGTPIGNLADASPRLRATLAAAHIILGEDTRRIRQLLAALEIPAPVLRALRSDNESSMADQVVDAVAAGQRVALVCDAGMPGISDPGGNLVRRARDRAVGVEVIPGPCAVSAAIARIGLATTPFVFVGFLPRAASPLEQLIRDHRAHTIVAYESPRRVVTSVKRVAAAQPERVVHIARELTKVHEEVISAVASQFDQSLVDEVRGEVVLVMEPLPVDLQSELERAATLARELIGAGLTATRAAAIAARHEGVRRNSVYGLVATGDCPSETSR